MHPHISLYTAILDVDALHTTTTAAPVDLVSPNTAPASASPASAGVGPSQAAAPASCVAAWQLDGSNRRQADEQQAASTAASPARTATDVLGRISQVTSQPPSSTAQANAQHRQQDGSWSQPAGDADGQQAYAVAAVSSNVAVQQQVWSRRLPWPFNRGA